ncbi:Intracellular septation protein A [gamma proteobacterium HIMB55]|nr:Intracellular septation protein A [gamma proteobacterium HIMB55]
MKQALEFFPLVVFVAVFNLSGKTLTLGEYAYTFDSIYSATIALVVATLMQVIIVKIVWGKVEKRLLVVAAAVALFGGATVVLRDPVFIFWKPTVFNWGLAGIYVVWHLVRKRCFFQELLPDEIEMPQHAWNKVTLVSTLHFFMVGAVNLYVAYNYSMATWVSFKLWSAFLFTILWAVIIGVIMGPYLKEADLNESEDPHESQAKSAATSANDETTRTF